MGDLWSSLPCWDDGHNWQLRLSCIFAFGPHCSTKSIDSIVYLGTLLAQSRNYNPSGFLYNWGDHNIFICLSCGVGVF